MTKKKDKNQKGIGTENMLRFYDTDLIERLNKRFNESGSSYENRNHFLTDLIEAGLNRREQEISFKDKLVANETQMYKSIDAFAGIFLQFTEYVRTQFQAIGAKLYCAECGTGMVGVSGKTQCDSAYHYYKCLNHIHNEGCKIKAVGKDRLENDTIRATKDIMTDERIAEIARDTAAALDKVKNSGTLSHLKKKLADNKKAIDTLLNTLSLGRSQDLILDKIDKLQDENAELDFAIAKETSVLFKMTEKDIIDVLTRIRDFTITDNDIKGKQLFVETYVYRVFYHKDETLTVMVRMTNNGFDKPPRGTKIKQSGAELKLGDVEPEQDVIYSNSAAINEKGLISIPFGTHKSFVAGRRR